MPVSSSFRSENSGTASPSLYAQQSPCLHPVHSGLFPGNQGSTEHSQGLPYRDPGSTPQPSFPSLRQAMLSGNLAVSPWPVQQCPTLGETSPPLENSPFLEYPEPARPVRLPPHYLMENHTRPTVPSLGSTVVQGLLSPSFCTDRPRRLRVRPTHVHAATSVGATLSLLGPHSSTAFLHLLSPFPLRTSSRFRMLRQRPWA